MSEEKKSFFASLEPKSAAVVGVVTGVLTLCTIGFIVMLVISMSGKASANNKAAEVTQTADNKDTAPASVPKSDRPKVELFVMSYCPYGLQMEKAYLPAWDLLKNKADLSVKFVSYSMHGLKELEENTRQYCIETEQSDRYIAYLKCFTGKDDFKACLKEAKIDQGKMNSCVNTTNKKFAIMDKYNDQSTWLNGNYPVYPVNADLNDAYSVQGSPTLIVNGVETSANRTPEDVKKAICAAFNNPPAECNQKLSTASPAAGFGASTGSAGGNAGCGN